jgi:hypothetical protein
LTFALRWLEKAINLQIRGAGGKPKHACVHQ